MVFVGALEREIWESDALPWLLTPLLLLLLLFPYSAPSQGLVNGEISMSISGKDCEKAMWAGAENDPR